MKKHYVKGFTKVTVLMGAAIVIAGLSGFLVYRSKTPSSQTYKGIIATQNCQPNDNRCQKQSLAADDGKSYELTGQDASAYAGQRVIVSGTMSAKPSEQKIDVKSIQPDNQEPAPQTTFNAEQFYDRVQNGMTYSQVASLAGGQAGACEYSGAPPPADYMICTWKSSFTEVSVSFQDQKVNHKSKSSL